MASGGNGFHNYFSEGVDNGMEEDGVDSTDIVVPACFSGEQSSNGGGAQGGQEQEGSEQDSRSFMSLFKRVTSEQGTQPLPNGPEAPCKISDLMYNMEFPNRGRCVIFNHNKFDKIQQLPDRSGSDTDVRKITNVFSSLGFQVMICNDYKFERIMETLQRISLEDHSQNDCLVVFVLTHGQSNILHAYDITYKPSVLWDFFTANKCKSLAGKPKMFFIQACRGAEYDDGTDLQVKFTRTEVDGPGDQTYRIPNQADFLTVFSTYEASNFSNFSFKQAIKYLGYYSWRNSKSGSCFIQAMCKVFTEWHPYKDVLNMMTIINREVAINYESRCPKDLTQHRKKQVPHVCHTLMRDIYLFPKHRSTLV